MSFRNAMIHDLRLTLLQILAEAPGYQAGSGVLIAALEGYGHIVSGDTLAMELAWLEEQGLVSLRRLPVGLAIATATDRGRDVAKGAAMVPGVRRPDPGE